MCVYTALLGGYERLNEQPAASRSKIPFLCLTDDPLMRSDSWQMRPVSPLFSMDPVRSQRDFKLRPHLHLPDFDLSIYIDNSVLLTEAPERIMERHLPASGFAIPRHSDHVSVLDEFLEVAKRGYDDPSRIFEQLNHYSFVCPEVLAEQPYWAGILLRDHHRPEARAVLETWYAHVLRYSRRDQLSINAAFRLTGFTPDAMDIDNWSSWFHTWPHTPGRDRGKGSLDPAASFGPPVARVRQLERQLAEAERLHKEMMSSDAWRIGKRLVEGADRHPRLAGPVLRAARLLTGRKGTSGTSPQGRG
ncbi:MAG: hypothetical protein A2W26_06325 [Acidobacteria bacterium RBG_16_64_8]|nr:MAG: hypothetical protein A2W26_06325 [Acidobacteria bacterium RBG_16_64_8]